MTRKSEKNKLEVGNRVLVEKAGHWCKHKIADLWEEEPYTVLDKPQSDIPMFKVIREGGQGRVKTLHRNQLLPFFCQQKGTDTTATDGEAEFKLSHLKRTIWNQRQRTLSF